MASGASAATLLMHCPDRRGVVAAVAEFLRDHGANILDLDEHVDERAGTFLMRVAWDLSRFEIPPGEIGARFRDEVASGEPVARPYHAALERGVKIIGATSHFVTEELDSGPIIEQDVVHVTHHDDVADLVRKGRDLEKVVLARAVWLYLRLRLLVCGNRTVVFR